MNKFVIIGLLGALMFSKSITAQQSRGGEDTLKTRIVTVIDYKPTISDARKLAESPQVIDSESKKPDVNYLFDRRQMQTNYKPDTIKAAKMKSEPLDPLYRSYVKAGAGNGVNYLLDAHVNAARSRNGALGLNIHGIGTQGVLADVPPAPYNRWATSIYGKRFFKRHELSGKVGFDRERTQYYGYSNSDTVVSPLYLDYQGNEDVFRQVYTEVYTDVSLKSFYTDSSKLNHKLDLHYDNFADRNRANFEHNVVFNAHGSRFFGAHQGALDLLIDHNQVNYVAPINPSDSSSIKRGNSIIGLTPKVISQGEKWRLELGLNAQIDASSNNSSLHLYPDLYARYNLIKNIIIPYVGVKGGLERNNLNSLTEKNPFLWTSLTSLQNTNRAYHAFGGFRGAVSNRFTYNLHAGQYLERNTPLFINYDASDFNPGLSPFGQNYFLVTYDTLTVFEVGGELTYRIDNKLHTVVSGVFRNFQVSEQVIAWHRPNFELTGAAFYQLQHKITLRAELHILGPQKAKRYRTYDQNDAEAIDTEFINGSPISVVSEELKPIIDASLGVEYRYTERLSGFLNVNNILVQRYQRWNQYPVQRFNVLAGITYAFWKE